VFEETPNVNMNPLPNHVLGSGSVNALEEECPGNLKAPMKRAGYREGSMYS
jgi:hypothetical protein